MGTIFVKLIFNTLVNPLIYFGAISSTTGFTSKMTSNTIKYVINAIIITLGLIVAGLIFYYNKNPLVVGWARTIIIFIIGLILLISLVSLSVAYITGKLSKSSSSSQSSTK